MLIQRAAWVKALSKRANQKIEKSDEIHEKVKKKRKARRSKSKSEEEKKDRPHPEFGQKTLEEAVGQQNGRQTKKDIVNWYIVQGWFWREISNVNKEWLVVKERGTEKKQTWWVWTEKNCAERLLKHYGPKVLERTVKWFVGNWQAMKDRSGGALTGAPTVQLLWASRERIFPDAEAGVVIKPYRKRQTKKRKRIDRSEYNDEAAKKAPGMGW